MIIENVNVLKLHKEFVLADIHPHPVSDLGSYKGEFIFQEDTDLQLVHHIINAHDSTPLPQPLTEIERLRLEQAQANAEMFEMLLKMTGGSL